MKTQIPILKSSTFRIFQVLCTKSVLRIRDPGWGKIRTRAGEKSGSGLGKIRIQDKHLRSAKLVMIPSLILKPERAALAGF